MSTLKIPSFKSSVSMPTQKRTALMGQVAKVSSHPLMSTSVRRGGWGTTPAGILRSPRTKVGISGSLPKVPKLKF